MSKVKNYPNFSLLAKPAGPLCNLDCKYCFYLEKEAYFKDDERSTYFMDDKVLEEYVKQFIAGQSGDQVTFAFQGGEPTLIGLDYFRKLVELVKFHKKDHQEASFTLQTNGTKLNPEWAEFLKKNKFLVGVSIDGPAHVHDAYRVNKRGNPTHERVLKAIDLLKEYSVDFNTLTVVNGLSTKHSKEIYKYLKSIGSNYMQFIPIVERIDTTGEELCTAPNLDELAENYQIPDWNVRPRDFGQFYIDIYDQWVNEDVGKIYIQMFDLQLGFEMGEPSSLCVYSKTCGSAGIMEHNGDVYSCDHFVYPEYKLGNLLEKSLSDMFESEFQHEFGQNKYDKLPKYCLSCEFLEQCYGGCPKNRFIGTPKEKEPGLNYLCAGYKMFFAHIKPTMNYMANCLRKKQPPFLVMKWINSGEMAKDMEKNKLIGRNDICPCASGLKYKQCCSKK